MMRSKKKMVGNYPSAGVLFSVVLSLLVLGIFVAILMYSSLLEEKIRAQITMHVYLKNELSDAQKNQIRQTLLVRYFTQRQSADEAVRFVSKAEAAKTFIKETGEDFTKFLDDNPLRDAYVVRIKPIYHDALSMKKIKSEIEKMPGVFEADYVETVVTFVQHNLSRVAWILISLAVIFLIAAVSLIHQSVRLALFSQRFLIRSMLLVGATRSFIRNAFIRHSFWLGIVGGMVSSALLYGLLYYLTIKLPEISILHHPNMLWLLMAVIFLVSLCITFFSTWAAVRKYQKISLDELF